MEKYIDLMEAGAEQTISRYLLNGWQIRHRGLTLVILEPSPSKVWTDWENGLLTVGEMLEYQTRSGIYFNPDGSTGRLEDLNNV